MQIRNSVLVAAALAAPSLLLAPCAPAWAVATTYRIDPEHTFPSFEADHMGGLSVWRGKFNRSEGSIVLDRQAGAGSVEARIDVSSVDFGHDRLNQEAKGDSLLQAGAHPEAVYRGRLAAFRDGVPGEVDGQLTLRGITLPVKLRILSFKCMPHVRFKREVCGADAVGEFERDRFGIDAGKDYGFDMTVTLRIQVEAIAEPAPATAAGAAGRAP